MTILPTPAKRSGMINTIIRGDCLEVLRSMPDCSVDAIITDPPYGLDKKLSSGGGKHKDAKFRLGYVGQSWDKVISEEYWDEVFRVSKNQVIFGANYYSLPPTRGMMCWDKRQMLPTFSRCEFIWTSFQVPSRIYVYSHDKDRYHPTQKPVELMKRLIVDFTEKGDLILDPFCGSGTTCVAAKLTDRRWIGIELKEEYAEMAERRIAKVEYQEELF